MNDRAKSRQTRVAKALFCFCMPQSDVFGENDNGIRIFMPEKYMLYAPVLTT